MATEVQFRDGTDAQVEAFTGAVSEGVVSTDSLRWYLHDGATTGGMPTPNARWIWRMRRLRALQALTASRFWR